MIVMIHHEVIKVFNFTDPKRNLSPQVFFIVKLSFPDVND